MPHTSEKILGANDRQAIDRLNVVSVDNVDIEVGDDARLVFASRC